MTIATSTIVGFFIAGIVPLMFIIGGLYKLRRIHKYPLIAIVLGYILVLCNIQLPPLAASYCRYMNQITSPLALFSLPGTGWMRMAS